MEKPPEASFEKSPYQNRVISFTHITLVLVNRLNQRHNSFLQQLVFWHIFWCVALIYNFAQISNKFLFNDISYLSTLNEAIIEHVLLHRHSDLFS